MVYHIWYKTYIVFLVRKINLYFFSIEAENILMIFFDILRYYALEKVEF